MSLPICPPKDAQTSATGTGQLPLNVADYEAHAHAVLPRNALSYYASGANDQITLHENRAAFSRLRLMPKILVDVTHVDMSTTILGVKVSSPICIAPTAMQKMAHPDGECATAKAAARHDTLMTLSSWSTTSLEDVAAAGGPKGYRWFQLYVYKDRAVTLDLVRRAERAGYKALAVTVDTPVLGRRESDVRNGFVLPAHLTMGNFKNVKQGENSAGGGAALAKGGMNSAGGGSALAKYVASLIDQSLSWKDIAWLRKNTTLKIVVKGVMTVEDAVESVRQGVDAIWISNHGARQLDTVPATIEVLPDIARAVGNKVEIYLDGGVTRGTDVLKAISLGARAVFVGRPSLWGLTYNGEEGVSNVLQLLKDEFKMALQLMGCTKIEELKPSLIRSALSFQSKL